MLSQACSRTPHHPAQAPIVLVQSWVVAVQQDAAPAASEVVVPGRSHFTPRAGRDCRQGQHALAGVQNGQGARPRP